MWGSAATVSGKPGQLLLPRRVCMVNMSNMPSARSKAMVTGCTGPFEQTVNNGVLWKLHINHMKQRIWELVMSICFHTHGLSKVRGVPFWSNQHFLHLLISDIIKATPGRGWSAMNIVSPSMGILKGLLKSLSFKGGKEPLKSIRFKKFMWRWRMDWAQDLLVTLVKDTDYVYTRTTIWWKRRNEVCQMFYLHNMKNYFDWIFHSRVFDVV